MKNFKAKMACCGLYDYYPVADVNGIETVDRPFHTSLSGTYVVNVKNFDVDNRDELHITYGLFTGKYQSGHPLGIKNQTSIMLLPNGEISCYKMGEYESVPHFIKLFLSGYELLFCMLNPWEIVMLSVIQKWMQDKNLKLKAIKIVK